MTWKTPNGDRILVGPEAALVKAILADMCQLLKEEARDGADQWTYDVRLFDELSWPQRLGLLVLSGEALLRPHVLPPKLTAVNEATLGAICMAIDQALKIELDYAKDDPDIVGNLDVYRWRRMILDCHEPSNDLDYQLLAVSCPNFDEWDILLHCLEDGLLWDDDWDMPELFLDVDPGLSRARRSRLGIPKDYYTALAADPRDDEVPGLWKRFHDLIEDRPAS